MTNDRPYLALLYKGGGRGGMHYIKSISADHEKKEFHVKAKHVVQHIPGFIAGAPYAIFPISKVLKRIRFSWKLKQFERIGENLWRYTFTVPGTDFTIIMDASNGETNKG